MGKKAQISLFVIVGIIFLIIVSGALIFKISSTQKSNEQSGKESFAFKADLDYLTTLIQKCVRQSVIDGERLYGLDQENAVLIGNYAAAKLPLCVENFKSYEEQGYMVEKGAPAVDVKITFDSLIADVSYPVKITKSGKSISFDKTSYTFPRTITERLNKDKPTTIVSSDGKMAIEIPAGTEVTLDGKAVDTVGIKQLDRNFNGLSNSVLAGMMAYNGIPHGAVFSKPIKMTYYYEDRDIPLYINERDVKVGYYSDTLDMWIGLPTEVDMMKNKLSVETTHFSIYGSVVKCGANSDDVISQVITPVLIQEGCGPCQFSDPNQNWKYAADFKSDSPIYPGVLYNSADLITTKGVDKLEDYTSTSEGCNSELYTSTVQPQGSKFNPCDFSTECSMTDTKKCGVQKCICDKRYEFLDFTVGALSFDNTQITEKAANLKDTLNGVAFSNLDTEKTFLENINTLSIDKKFASTCIENGKDGANCIGKCLKLNVKYDLSDLYLCVKESCAYEKVEDLKGRQVYELHFKGLGDSCIDSKQEEDTTEIDVGDGIDQVDSSSGTDVKVKRESVTVTYTETNDKLNKDKITMTLNLQITPICYEEDTCVIKNAHFKKGTDNDKILEFTVEAINGKNNDGTKVDACLMGAAQIQFIGSGATGDISMLCNKDSIDKLDYVNGKCSKCVKKIDNSVTTYMWEKSDINCKLINCDNFEQGKDCYCASSLIGKMTKSNSVCYVCNPYSNFYGKWEKYEGECATCDEIPTESVDTTTSAESES